MKHSKRRKQLWNEFIGQAAAFSLMAVSIALLWRDNPLLFIVVLVEGLAALGLWHDRYDLGFFLVIGVLGSLAEAWFVRFGVWRYGNPTFLGLPLWFPVAFGTAALIGGRLVRTITAIWEQARVSRASKE
jgi:hypothetical protein